MEKEAAPAYDAPSVPPPQPQIYNGPSPQVYNPQPPQDYNGPPPQQMWNGPSAAQVGAQYQQEMYARCARGDHEVRKRHGAFGIITAIVFFPIGLLCFFTNVHRECRRCGAQLD